MATARQIKRAARALRSVQELGISDGDKCPCCGQTTMSANCEENSFFPALGLYICNACGFDLEFGSLSSNDIDYDSWDMLAGTESDGENEESGTSQWIPIPKFHEGDRVIDIHSDWPGTVTHVLPQGVLYEVRLDGKHKDIHILKDREMLFEMHYKPEKYAEMIRSHFSVGDIVQIEKIESQVGDTHSGQQGRVEALFDNGGISVQLFESKDTLILYPDVDRFQLLKSKTATLEMLNIRDSFANGDIDEEE